MRVEVVQGEKVLRQVCHEGQTYVEAKGSGEYEIRLTNNTALRRLAVLSVDGINVIEGKDAGYDGSGFVLEPWKSITVKGFLRSGRECARFTFAKNTESYANQTGRGTKNTGVIGVAVFDEQKKPETIVVTRIVDRPVYIRPYWTYPWAEPVICSTLGSTSELISTLASTQASASVEPMSYSARGSSGQAAFKSQKSSSFRSETAKAVPRRKTKVSDESEDLGTAYGKAEAFHTEHTSFVRASASPALVLSLRYATKKTLLSWGVPLDERHVVADAPEAFPAEDGYAAAPAGWTP